MNLTGYLILTGGSVENVLLILTAAVNYVAYASLIAVGCKSIKESLNTTNICSVFKSLK